VFVVIYSYGRNGTATVVIKSGEYFRVSRTVGRLYVVIVADDSKTNGNKRAPPHPAAFTALLRELATERHVAPITSGHVPLAAAGNTSALSRQGIGITPNRPKNINAMCATANRPGYGASRTSWNVRL